MSPFVVVGRDGDTLDGVSDEDLRPAADRRPRVVLSERLTVPVWWWVLLAALTAAVVASGVMIGTAWWVVAVVVAVAVLLAWWFVNLGRERVEVLADGQGGGTLVAGGARLPFDVISRCAVVPASAKMAAMGRQLDPEAFVVHRNYVPTMAIVVLDDPLDPTPYWLVSTRDPERLLEALPCSSFE